MFQNGMGPFRKKYKKELAFKKKFNAMKGWTIKNLDEIIQDYFIEMNTIPENQDEEPSKPLI